MNSSAKTVSENIDRYLLKNSRENQSNINYFLKIFEEMPNFTICFKISEFCAICQKELNQNSWMGVAVV
jgi:hypothetical protein